MDISALTGHQGVDQPGIITVITTQFNVNLTITRRYRVCLLVLNIYAVVRDFSRGTFGVTWNETVCH